MTRLLLIRHAHAFYPPDERRPLSKRGEAAARDVARLLDPLDVDAVYSSPSRRAYQTIEPLADARGLSIGVVQDLRERLLSPTPIADFMSASEATWSDSGFAHKGGESNQSAQQRFADATSELLQKHPGECVAVATHGTVLALFLQAIDPAVDFEFWQALSMPDVFEVRYGVGECVCQRIWPEK